MRAPEAGPDGPRGWLTNPREKTWLFVALLDGCFSRPMSPAS
jgi:hypothetical protein